MIQIKLLALKESILSKRHLNHLKYANKNISAKLALNRFKIIYKNHKDI